MKHKILNFYKLNIVGPPGPHLETKALEWALIRTGCLILPGPTSKKLKKNVRQVIFSQISQNSFRNAFQNGLQKSFFSFR